MTFTPSFPILALSVFIMCVGGALYSGTLEALVFDSLKEKGWENKYAKAISNIGTINLISPAICSILGGFMYLLWSGLPFFANAVLYSLGFFLCFLLREPTVDTVKFSFTNFVSQTQRGIKELCKTLNVKRQTTLLLSIGFAVVIADEMLNGFLGVEFGFKEKQLGILTAAIYLISAGASQLTPKLLSLQNSLFPIFLVGFLISLTLIVSPKLGLALGGLVLIINYSLQAIFNNLTSIAINVQTESRYRATTISTFNMIKTCPMFSPPPF